MYVCGNNENGQLGLGNNIQGLNKPTKLDLSDPVIDFVCGESHCIAVTDIGTIYGWGQGVAGAFGES
jgi:alpha-tubulin suppressor-like RCC1 family protein